MEIKRFQVTNIGRFSSLDIPLAPTEESTSNITILMGNNGAGKTSLLNALATALSWLVARIRSEKGNGSPISEHSIKNDKPWGAIDIELFDFCGQKSKQGADENNPLFQWSLVKAQQGKKADKNTSLLGASELANVYRTSLTSNEEYTSLPLVAYYPVERVVLDIPLKVKTKHTFKQLDGYDNSLNQGVDFRRFFEWFRDREDVENEAGASESFIENFINNVESEEEQLQESTAHLWELLKKAQASSRDRQLTAVRTAISQFMPGFSKLRIKRKPRLTMTIDKDGETLNVAQLSQGEKSLMALVGDIARRLAMMNPSLENPLEGDGIVLIDEVDLHLHPKWQMTLLERLSSTFPGCQFVVTTHSPLVISGAPNLLCYSLDEDTLVRLDSAYGLDANLTLAQAMDSGYRNEQVQSWLDDLLDAIQDGHLDTAKVKLQHLEEILPAGHIELSKAALLIRKLEVRREKNQ